MTSIIEGATGTVGVAAPVADLDAIEQRQRAAWSPGEYVEVAIVKR
jgi:hypothetical protein